MKIVCLGDLHLLWDKPIARKDDAHEVQRKKFKFVLDWARKNQAVVIQPGDFFDTARSWHLTFAYAKFLDDYYTQNKDMDIYVVYGQHDTYMYSEETRHATSLGLLIANRLVKLLDSEGAGLDYTNTVWAYGASYGQAVPRVEDSNNLNILVIHKMIVDEKLWAGQEDYVYAEDFLDKYSDYDLIICGDCHRRFDFEQDGRYIVNSGPLFRKEADIYNMTQASPGFYVYDTDKKKLDWVDVPHELADVVLSRDHIERQEKIDRAMEEFISSMHIYDGEGDDSMVVNFMDNLTLFLEENKVGRGVRDILSSVMDEEIK